MTPASTDPRRHRVVAVSLALSLAFLTLYVATLAPDLVGHDAGEFQFVPAIFGIPHYTGYPLYLLLGKAWSLLPLGSVAWRMNLLSAVFGALAAGLTCAAAFELTGWALAGVLAGVAVGLAPLEWTWSTMAGVRSLAAAFVALALLAVLHWERAVAAGDAKLARRRLIVLAAVAGFGLDHHRTFALLLPFLAAFVLLVRWRTLLDLAGIGQALAAFAAPLALYGVLPLRAAHGAPFDQTNTATWPGFVSLVIAGTDSAAHLTLTSAQALARVPDLGSALLGTFSPLALLLCLSGLAVLAARRPAWAVLLGGYAAALGWLTVVWNIGGQLNLVYLMPAYPPLALLAAYGLAAPLSLLARRSEAPGAGSDAQHDGGSAWRLAAGVLACAVVAAGGLQLGRGRFQPAPEALDDFRQELFRGHQARRLADGLAALPPNATVVADWDQATPLWYAEFVDRINPGVGITYPAATLPNALRTAAGPVFLATAAFRPATTALSAVGPFVEVLQQPRTSLPSGLVPFGGSFGDEIRLAGMDPLAQPRHGVQPVTLYWQALRQPAADYHVSVRLMPSPDRVAVQRDEAAPVLGLSPTSSWVAGQVTADYYELDLRTTPDGAYDLSVVLYQALPGGGFRNLPYGGGERAVVGRLTLNAGQTSFAPAA
jgi:hypothetical protein